MQTAKYCALQKMQILILRIVFDTILKSSRKKTTIWYVDTLCDPTFKS